MGAADEGWGLEGLGGCRSGSLRSSAAGGGHTEAAQGCHSLLAASYARTMQPTAARRAAPIERKREGLLKMRVGDTAKELERIRGKKGNIRKPSGIENHPHILIFT